MDKNVYNMKAEKIQKLVKQGDYETAAKICETIEWDQVRSARMLSLVSSVYEHVGRYDTAIDILLMAYEEAPVGRRLLYKLTELAIASGNIPEAEEYYKNYIKEADDDNARYILRYKIAEAKDESLEKRISILEAYKRQEFDEQWSYRLAELYAENGDTERCTKLCDEIVLWFGVGTYVDKALELKEQFAPLTESQIDHRDNRAVYEENLRNVQRDFADAPEVSTDVASSLASGVMEAIESGDDIPQIAIAAPSAMTNAVESGQQVNVDPSAFHQEDDIYQNINEDEEEQDAFGNTIRVGEKSDLSRTRIFSKIPENESERKLFSTITASGNTIKVEAPSEEDEIQVKAEEPLHPVQMEFDFEDLKPVPPAVKLIFLESNSPDEAVEEAVEKIKAAHESERTSTCGITKISGMKLNAKGAINSLEALKGKDLIVLGASAMDDEILQELMLVMEKFDTKKFFVLADSPQGIDTVKARLEKMAEEEEAAEAAIIESEPEAVEEPVVMEPVVEEAIVEEPVIEEAVEEPVVTEEPTVIEEATAAEEPETIGDEIAKENEFAYDEEVAMEYDDLPEIKLNDYFDDLEEASETVEVAQEEPVEETIEEATEEVIEETVEESTEEKVEEPAIEEIEEPLPEIKLTPDEELVVPEPESEQESEPELEQEQESELEQKPEPEITSEPELQTSEQERAEEPIATPELKLEIEPDKNHRTMTPDDFMKYIKGYMKKIDCAFDEGAEAEVDAYVKKLFGDGEQLDSILAEDMVEDAADAAESHSFGNMFKSRYNEDGLLLLRAKHFV